MVKSEVKSTIKFPDEFLTQDDLLKVANQIFIPLMVQGIDRREAIDGGPLPTLEKVTIKMKGHDRPLIDTGTLRRSFYAMKRGKNEVKVSILGERLDEATKLQITGVDYKHGTKYFKFFGINTGMEREAIDFLKRQYEKIIRKFNGK
jgi:hypothetical protein